MIFLFTDFGQDGPYLGQVAAVLLRADPPLPVVHLFNDVPPFDARGAAYLLSAYTVQAVSGDVVLAVIDPGVGTSRRALAVWADDVWYVGPDNGLLANVVMRAREVETWEIGWRPKILSDTFHGRDLFAPAAARLAAEGRKALKFLDARPLQTIEGEEWPSEHEAIVYFDRFGNAITGCRASGFDRDTVLEVGGQAVSHAFTFGHVPAGTAFWYENANGLVEIAVNQGSAQAFLGAALGSPVRRRGAT